MAHLHISDDDGIGESEIVCQDELMVPETGMFGSYGELDSTSGVHLKELVARNA